MRPAHLPSHIAFRTQGRRGAAARLTMVMVGLAAIAGCTEPAPIDPAAMAQKAGLRAQDIVHNAGGGVSFAADEDSGAQKILSGLSTIQGGVSGKAAVMPAPPAVPPAMMRSMADNPMIRALAGDGSDSSVRTTEEQFDDTASDLKLWLQERILVAANLESRSNDAATYLLHADPTCRPLVRAEDPPGTVKPISKKCQEQLDKLQIRVVMTADGDGARLEIVVGPDRLQLSAFIIHSDLLAAESDLPRSKAAAEYIDRALGEESPMNGASQTLTALAGRVRLSLHKDGERKVTFGYSVLDALHVAQNDTKGQPAFDFALAKADPLLSVTADGVAKSLTVNLAVGAIDVRFPWRPMGNEPGNLDSHVSVGGITGVATFAGQKDELRIVGLGVGETVYEVKGQRVFDLNLNPQSGHRFDVLTTLNAAGSPRFEITPRFDLSLAFKLSTIAAQLKDPPPAHLLDETYAVVLANPAGAAVVEAVKGNDVGFAGGLKVAAGSLTLSSTKVGSPLVVPGGKCLTSVSMPAADAHQILGKLAAVDCP